MRSRPSEGLVKKLNMTYTRRLAGGKQRVHRTPEQLWTEDEEFAKFVDNTLFYWRKHGSGTDAMKRTKAVNVITNYGHQFGWLEWKGRIDGASTDEDVAYAAKVAATIASR